MPHNHVPVPLTEPEAWSMLLVQIGRGCVIGAAVLLLLSALLMIFGGRRAAWSRIGQWAFGLGCAAILATFGVLATLMLRSQFQVAYVYAHSDRGLETPYKIAALWAGQEGSFLLWAVTTAIFGLMTARKTGGLRRWYTASYAIFLASLAAILAYESPFRVEMISGKYMPPDGSGMTPALINYWITIHPPVIFLGFGSLTVLFCWAFAALIERQHAEWAAAVRPWAIVSSTLLGIGLCMGGFWAYETLGWGGFWAWDPVENTSFVPWVWTVVLLHGLLLQATRGQWVRANLAIAGTSLSTFIYGTFLTRSGIYGDQSVHSFAKMDPTAKWVLIAILGVYTLAFLAIWVSRLKSMASKTSESGGINREALLNVGMILLGALAVVAAIGMSVPLANVIQGQKPKAVEEAVYNRILAWPIIPFFLAMAISPIAPWRAKSWRELWAKLNGPLTASLILLAGLIVWMRVGVPEGFKPEAGESVWAPGGRGLAVGPWFLFLAWQCLFVGCAAVAKLKDLMRGSKLGLGGMLSHVGIAVAMLGLILSRGFQRKEQTVVQAGHDGFALHYVIELGDTKGKDFLKRGNTVPLKFKALSGKSFTVNPELYYVQDPNSGDMKSTAHPAIMNFGTHDIYVAVFPMVFEAGDLQTLAAGKSIKIEDATLTFHGLQRVGEAGMMGTRFIANMTVKTPSGSYEVSPEMALGQNGPQFIRAEVPEYTVSLESIDAKTKEARVQLYYRNPLYPIDVYYKPMTLLVWLGAGILLVGGFMSAFYRRPRASSVPRDVSKTTESESNIPHASVSTPQS